jgi:hypothetical protein
LSKVFNIVATSLGLIGYFLANPVAHAERRHLPRAILARLGAASRPAPLPKPRHLGGHCYAFDMPTTLVDDGIGGSSTLLLFEDKRSLPRRHYRKVKEIAAIGMGAYCHARDKLFFASTDNTSPLENGRRYTVIHSLTGEPEKCVRLFAWEARSKSTGAARFLERLSLLCPGNFAYEKAEGAGPGVTLNGISLALDLQAQLRLTAESATVEPVRDAKAQWSFTIRNLRETREGAPVLSLGGILDLAPEADFILPQLRIEGTAGFGLDFSFGTAEGLRIELARPGLLRNALRASFATDQDLVHWAGGIADYLAAPLDAGGFGLSFDPDSGAAFQASFTPEGANDRYQLEVASSGGTRAATLRRTPL